MNVGYEMHDEGMDVEDFHDRMKWEKLESNLDEYLELLTEEERQVLVLKYRMNYSVKELQKVFALSASAVKMRLHRARLKMSQLISQELAA
jgi:RNA polymerase sigma-70 factor (ECF subfamily)